MAVAPGGARHPVSVAATGGGAVGNIGGCVGRARGGAWRCAVADGRPPLQAQGASPAPRWGVLSGDGGGRVKQSPLASNPRSRSTGAWPWWAARGCATGRPYRPTPTVHRRPIVATGGAAPVCVARPHAGAARRQRAMGRLERRNRRGAMMMASRESALQGPPAGGDSRDDTLAAQSQDFCERIFTFQLWYSSGLSTPC